jgi:hypothetical protein
VFSNRFGWIHLLAGDIGGAIGGERTDFKMKLGVSWTIRTVLAVNHQIPQLMVITGILDGDSHVSSPRVDEL